MRLGRQPSAHNGYLFNVLSRYASQREVKGK